MQSQDSNESPGPGSNPVPMTNAAPAPAPAAAPSAPPQPPQPAQAPAQPSSTPTASQPPQAPTVPRVMVVLPTDYRHPDEPHPFVRESRQLSRQTLGLPDDHPGFVPLSTEPWKPWHICLGVCGRPVSDHAPTFDERLWSVKDLLPGAFEAMQAAGWSTADVAGLFSNVEHYALVPGTRFNGVDGLVCSAGCLYLKEPDHPVFAVDREHGVDHEKALAPEIRRIKRVLALRAVSEHSEGPVE